MTQLAQKLDKKLASWRPEVAAQVEQIVTDAIELADTDTLDLHLPEPSYKKCSIRWMNAKPGDIWLADLGLAAKTPPCSSSLVMIRTRSRTHHVRSADHSTAG